MRKARGCRDVKSGLMYAIRIFRWSCCGSCLFAVTNFAGVLCLVLMMIFPLPLHPLILVHEMHNCVQYRMPAPVIYTEISRRRMDATYEPLLLKSLVIHGEVMIGAIDPHLQSMCSIDNTRHWFDRANSDLDQFVVASD